MTPTCSITTAFPGNSDCGNAQWLTTTALFPRTLRGDFFRHWETRTALISQKDDSEILVAPQNTHKTQWEVAPTYAGFVGTDFMASCTGDRQLLPCCSESCCLTKKRKCWIRDLTFRLDHCSTPTADKVIRCWLEVQISRLSVTTERYKWTRHMWKNNTHGNIYHTAQQVYCTAMGRTTIK